MSMQNPPENWPYGATFSGDQAEQARQMQTPATSASAPFQSQFAQPIGSGAAPAQPLPYIFPSYSTTPPATAPTPAAQMPGQIPAQMPVQMPVQMPSPVAPPLPLVEQSYIENILRLNLGKTASVYCTFEGNTEWNAKVFTGSVEAAGRDHVIIKDSGSETRFLIPMIFVNYITFTGPMEYSYPFAPPTQR